MKKSIIAALVVTSSMVSVSAFAEKTNTPAEAVVTWSGSAANSIPGDNIIITGENGSKIIPQGVLEMNIDGTFTSKPVVIESREYDEKTQVVGNKADAQWTVKGLKYSWGTNDTSNTKIVIKHDGNELPLYKPSTAKLSALTLTVENKVPVKNITDLTATATVAVELSASFEI